MRESIEFTLNGRTVTLDTDGERTLLWVLRIDMELTGTKYGCDIGLCGSCTVLVDGRAERSCALPVRAVQGKEVMTIEGMAQGETLHPLQEEFAERGALQCGYCTPGMIMSAAGLLHDNPGPTRDEIVEGVEGNLCRCSAYKRIIEAIEAASKRM
ncbi:(2Fe-2S)-binding protein [Candidatus Zixiibacteriota bacterium]